MPGSISCAFCGATLAGPPDPLMGLLDCTACGKLVQLTAEALDPEKSSEPQRLSGVTCQRCHKPLHRAAVDPKYGVAKCEGCGVVNDLGGRYRAAKLKSARKVQTVAQVERVSQPRMFEVLELKGALDISWKERSPLGFGLMALMVATMAGLVGMVKLAITPEMWIAFTALSILFFLYCAVVATGRMAIVARRDGLTIERRRLWWPRRVLPRAQLQQLYVTETRHEDDEGRVWFGWRLAALITGTAKPLKLTPEFTDPSYPRYLEQTLERYLGIKDSPVPMTYEGP